MPVLAASSASDCFHIMIEAFQMAVRYMTPVMVLSDSYLANSAEPWRIPEIESLPQGVVRMARAEDFGEEGFQPYRRDPDTLARPWAIPGTPGLEHRVGGLTKANVTGSVVYDPENHAEMVNMRAEKVNRIAEEIPPLDVDGAQEGEILVLGWGSTRGAITAATAELRQAGHAISRAHLRHMNPLPANLGEVLRRFRRVLVPELNEGQLAMLLRAHFLLPVESLTKVAGQPFKVSEIRSRVEQMLREEK
jgi:2-oxoglutarate ferredoxin oxidoreductase subunit alpha